MNNGFMNNGFMNNGLAHFLSDAWFDEVFALNEQAGELNLPPKLHHLTLTLLIDDTPLHIKEGKIGRGKLPGANSTIKAPLSLVKKMIQDQDMTVALEAFLLGQLKIEGDFSTIITLKGAKPSAEQKQLYKNILAITTF